MQSVDVVVVGQIARDLVLLVEELPAPGTGTAVRRRREMLGGKGANQAVALVQLGGRWRYLEHLPPEVLVSVPDVHAAAALLTAARTVVLQLQQPPQALLAAVHYAQRGGGRVVLDGAVPAGPHRDALLGAAQVLRADTHEAELLTDTSIGDGDDALRAGRELLLRHGLELVVLGAGEAGNALVWDGGATVLPLLDVDVVDSTGAGDAFTAGLVAELLRGSAPQEAGRLATAAAALSVGDLSGRPHLSQLGQARPPSGSESQSPGLR